MTTTRTARRVDWRALMRPAVKRNREIVRRVAAGESQTALALEYGVTRQRVHAIVARARKRAT